jgi:hypothetical protein
VPPFVGVAINVTEDPAHAGFVPDVIAIDKAGTKTGLTVIVIPFDVAGFPDVTQFEFEVITQVITLLVARADVTYVALLAPTLVPLFFHW